MVAPEPSSNLSCSLVRVPGSGIDRDAMPSKCDLGRVSRMAADVPINAQLPSFITKNARPPLPQKSEAEASAAKLRYKEPGKVTLKTSQRSQPYVVRTRGTNQALQASGNRGNTTGVTPFPMIPAAHVQPVELPANFMANKRAEIRYMTAKQVMNQAPNILHANTPAGPVLFMQAGPQPNKLAELKLVTRPRVIRVQSNNFPVQNNSNGQQGSGVTVMTLEQLINNHATLRQENQDLQQQLINFLRMFQNRGQLEEILRQLGINFNNNNN